MYYPTLKSLLWEFWKAVAPFITITLAIGIWEAFKFFYPDIRRIIESRIEAKNSFFQHLDPILKASSELFGKLESLAKEDFSTFINPQNSNSENPEHNRLYVYFLFCQFWAQLESLRAESQYTALSQLQEGKQLLRFVETFESRRFRILDRSVQRILGGCLLNAKEKRFPVMTLTEFVMELENPNSHLQKWVNQLKSSLDRVKEKEVRQRVLIYGVIVAALIDHFDPEYKSVRRRKIYRNKLSPKSRKAIQNTLLTHYIDFLKTPNNYH